MPNIPLQAKYSAHGDERHSVRCRELIGEDERRSGHVRDVCVPFVIPSALCLRELTSLHMMSLVSQMDSPYNSL